MTIDSVMPKIRLRYACVTLNIVIFNSIYLHVVAAFARGRAYNFRVSVSRFSPRIPRVRRGMMRPRRVSCLCFHTRYALIGRERVVKSKAWRRRNACARDSPEDLAAVIVIVIRRPCVSPPIPGCEREGEEKWTAVVLRSQTRVSPRRGTMTNHMGDA